ncbi:MAG: phosphatase PAP2 family protein [Povalibacter sp.]
MRMQLPVQGLSALIVLFTTGCASLPDGRGWGQDATLTPGWTRVREAATDAAKDPWVWAPLIGAAAFQIDNFDRRTSDWAREHTPVFGSEHNAEQWSDDLRNASAIAEYVTILATPSGDEPGEWIVNKAKGTLVDVAAVAATGFVTSTVKDWSDRERPNGDDSASFPSGHTSSSAVHTRLASRNLRSIDMSEGWRRTADVGLHALTIGTSWARIEAGWHYPSDTLVGMALGNFIASFVNDAFLPTTSAPSAALTVIPVDDGAVLQWNWSF